jgi:hypothetical integral membrane protein (TIGR02206 family)
MAPLTSYGTVQLLVLASVPSLIFGAIRVVQRGEQSAQRLRWFLITVLLAAELSYCASVMLQGGAKWVSELPLQLCNISCWLLAAALLTFRQPVVDIACYLGSVGPALALLTPQNWAVNVSATSVHFYVGHVMALVSVSFLAAAGPVRPRPQQVGLALAAVNVIAICVAAVNNLCNTNFMFLRDKPPESWLVARMGPWPWYLLVGEVLAIALFLLVGWIFARIREGHAQSGTDRRRTVATCEQRPATLCNEM